MKPVPIFGSGVDGRVVGVTITAAKKPRGKSREAEAETIDISPASHAGTDAADMAAGHARQILPNGTVTIPGGRRSDAGPTSDGRPTESGLAGGEAREGAKPRPNAVREIGGLFATLRNSPLRRRLLLLSLGIVAALIANMVGQVRLNAWYGVFFDALEARDIAAFAHQLLVFLGIVAALLVFVVGQTWLQEMLKVRMREWLTRYLLDEWLVPGRAYRLGIESEFGVNPDQRIQEDTRQLTELSAELGVGILQSSLLLISFIGVLWVLSAQAAFSIGGYYIAIPGYMVWCAVGYALLGSFLTWMVGRPLIRLNARRYAREAELRFAVVRMNESAESVGLYGGERGERRALNAALDTVVLAMRRLSGGLARLTWITSGYGWLALVIPIIAAAPSYFAGDLSLGGLMMVVGAFNQVQQALRWFVDHFPRAADWRAALGRVASFHEALSHADDAVPDEDRINLVDHPRGGLAFDRVGITLADGGVVIREATAEIRPGERVLVVGESGSGKSTLFRAIAGLWPWGTGTILLPPRETMMFMPQRPYLPLGTLRAAATYPAAPDSFDDDAVQTALERVGLRELVPMLDREERWDRALSIGEQQRLAFARLLLHRPRWVFLDEATAALDEENQRIVMSIFDEDLADTAVISIGHRPGLEAFHTKTLHLVSSPAGAKLRWKLHPREQSAIGPRRFGRSEVA